MFGKNENKPKMSKSQLKHDTKIKELEQEVTDAYKKMAEVNEKLSEQY